LSKEKKEPCTQLNCLKGKGRNSCFSKSISSENYEQFNQLTIAPFGQKELTKKQQFT